MSGNEEATGFAFACSTLDTGKVSQKGPSLLKNGTGSRNSHDQHLQPLNWYGVAKRVGKPIIRNTSGMKSKYGHVGRHVGRFWRSS
jgi:hypothetical protein